MEYQEQEYSYFLCCENETEAESLQSVRNAYFDARGIAEEEDIEENCSDYYITDEDSEDDCTDSYTDGEFDFSEQDRTERAKVEEFVKKSCGCSQGNQGNSCSSSIELQEIIDCRNNCFELTSSELDLVILGTIHASLNCDEVSTSGRKEKQRQRTRMPFYYHNQRICLKTFLFMDRIHQTRFYSLVKHYKRNGLSLRVHGNNKHLPSTAFSTDTIERVVKFIMNVTEEQALLLPGRVPGFKRIDVKLWPSSLTKHKLWKTYQDTCHAAGHMAVGYSKFCVLWQQLCPFVLIMRPATDLCWTCQKNNNHILRVANLGEAEKAEVVRQQERHLQVAMGEREYYKNCCKKSENLTEHLEDVDFSENRAPCTFEGEVHYSYDYAQ